MKNGMQFTTWFNSRQETEEWFRWFEGRNVPAAIVQTTFSNPTENRFAVFRKGMVGRKDRSGIYYAIKAPESKIFANHEVVTSCHGYVD